MPLSIGVNIRVTGHCNQGGRKYMEDMFSVAYQQSSNDRDLEYAFFGIFDGHGGGEAATFAKENLMDIIVKQKNFWSDRDEDVLRAIRDGYVNTHYAMWRELDKWPRTASGLPSTAGTTASIAFIRKGKIYIGHVGDSAIILGYQEDDDPQWKAKALTKDHKPESRPEMNRIRESGGKVISKSGVPRVVWNRPRIGHKGPVRRSTHIDEIPFLAVARSLGDLWSYNSELNTFVVSPEPDVKVAVIDVKSHRCLIFGTDGLWNMLTPQTAVATVQAAERHNEKHLLASQKSGQSQVLMWINPSKSLVDRALEKWSSTRMRADNTSVVTLMLDPPGPSHTEVLLSQKREQAATTAVMTGTSDCQTATPNVLAEAVPRSCSTEVPNPLTVPPEPQIVPSCIDDSNKQPDSSNDSEQAMNLSTKIECTENDKKLNDILLIKESIQVAEVSSSDASEEERATIDKPNLVVDSEEKSKASDEPAESVCELEKTFELKDTSLQSLQPEADESDTNFEMTRQNAFRDSSTDRFPLTRQNAFTGQCREFMETPRHVGLRLRRSVATTEELENLEVSPRVGAVSGTRRRPHTPLILHAEQQSMSYSSVSNQEELRKTSRKHTLTVSQKPRGNMSQKSSLLKDSSMSYLAAGNRFKRESKLMSGNEFDKAATKSGAGTQTRRLSYEVLTAKRKHSNLSQSDSNCNIDEPCTKRRTRSDDVSSPTDENDPANQKMASGEPLSRLRWHAPETSLPRTNAVGHSNSGTVNAQERRLSSPNSFQRRNLEKKVTPVKTIRRPSINGTNRVQLRGTFGLRDWDQGKSNRTSCNNRRRTVVGLIGSVVDPMSTPQRWLRSDTIAATPIKTLRSRNVDIAGHTIPAQVAHQYGTAKPNRLVIPAKLKTSSASSLLSSSSAQSPGKNMKSPCASAISSPTKSKGGCGQSNNNTVNSSASGSGIAKRVKTPYNLSSRSLSTRSRIKRLSK